MESYEAPDVKAGLTPTDSGTRGMPSAVEAIQGSADGEDILTGPA